MRVMTDNVYLLGFYVQCHSRTGITDEDTPANNRLHKGWQLFFPRIVLVHMEDLISWMHATQHQLSFNTQMTRWPSGYNTRVQFEGL